MTTQSVTELIMAYLMESTLCYAITFISLMVIDFFLKKGKISKLI